MRRMLTLVAALAGSAVLGGAAVAATGWHVFATGQDSGDYGAYASANASVTKPHALAVRVSRTANVSWNLSCDGETTLQAGRILTVSPGMAGTCRLYASGSTDTAGILRVQLLRR